MRGLNKFATFLMALLGLAFMGACSYVLHMALYNLPIMEGSHTNAAMACLVMYVIIGTILCVRHSKNSNNKPHTLYTNRPYRNDNKQI